jgi:hypothetical protein
MRPPPAALSRPSHASGRLVPPAAPFGTLAPGATRSREIGPKRGNVSHGDGPGTSTGGGTS